MEDQELINAFAHAINCASRENASNTPDFILASYLMECLKNYEGAVNAREKWHGREADKPSSVGVNDLMPPPSSPAESGRL